LLLTTVQHFEKPVGEFINHSLFKLEKEFSDGKIDFLGIWKVIYNRDFNSPEFVRINRYYE